MTKYITAAAFLIGMLLTFALTKCGGNHAKDLQTIATAQQDTGRRWVDKTGTKHLEKLVESGGLKSQKVFSKQQMDSVCSLLNLSRKQLSQYTKIDASAQGVITAPVQFIRLHDTVAGVPVGWSGHYIEWNDDWLSVQEYVDVPHLEPCIDSVTGSNDSCEVEGNATLFYKMKIPLDYVVYWRRKHKILFIRFGRKIYHLDLSSKNPNIEITNFKSIQIN